MKLVYAIPQRANAKRSTARHIDNGNGREPFFWVPEKGEPTCKICQDLAIMMASESADNTEKRVGD